MNIKKKIQNNGIEALDDLGIKVREYPDRYVLNYDQIAATKTDPLVMECRGLILAKDDLRVMSRTFDRFFNYGEAPDTYADMDFSHCSIFEKLDGSLISFYFDEINDRWEVATRGTAFAEAETPFGGITFRDVVYMAMGILCGDEVDLQQACVWMDRDCTYIFEVTSRFNRVVTVYSEPELHLLAVRNKVTGEYRAYDQGYNDVKHFAKETNRFTFDSIDHCLEAVHSLPDLKEGYVLYDQHGVPRCKVKSPAYVAVHAIRGEGVTAKRIIQLVMTNEHEEFLSYFPEYWDDFIPYIEAKERLNQLLDDLWELHGEKDSQKEFAMGVKDYPFSGVLFAMRNGRGKDASLRNLNQGALVRIFDWLMDSSQ